jgi:hypothetical protein
MRGNPFASNEEYRSTNKVRNYLGYKKHCLDELKFEWYKKASICGYEPVWNVGIQV